ncbi:MAG: hypothetical protein ACR2PL_24375 [Dehalococcoidia bacterium]
MSEYQYYEFQAIDRPLTKEEMDALRAISSRATITSTRLVNVYHYGDFKGEPLVLMQRYFDAHVYVANWGTHTFMLRLPRRLMPKATVDLYIRRDDLTDDGVVQHAYGNSVILEFKSQREEAEWEEGDDWLTSLLPLRTALAEGDLRSLYLAWLAYAYASSFDEDDEAAYEEEDDEDEDQEEHYEPLEPPVPPGLGDLTPSLKSLAEFLRLDKDLIAVAAERSAMLPKSPPSSAGLSAWIAALPPAEKDSLLLRLAEGNESHLQMELLRRFRDATASERRAGTESADGGRSIKELLALANEHTAERLRGEAEQSARERAKQEQQQALARAAYLDKLRGQEEKLWQQIDKLAEAKRAKEYDQAAELLKDLHDLSHRLGTQNAFQIRLHELRARHLGRPALIARFDQVGGASR